jgi:hypothetical protein
VGGGALSNLNWPENFRPSHNWYLQIRRKIFKTTFVVHILSFFIFFKTFSTSKFC